MDNYEIDEGFCGEDVGLNSPLGIEKPLDETAAISYQEVNLTSIISSTSGNYTTVFLGGYGRRCGCGESWCWYVVVVVVVVVLNSAIQ